MCVCVCVFVCVSLSNPQLPSRLGLQNRPTAPQQKGITPPTSDMTLNTLMVRFQ